MYVFDEFIPHRSDVSMHDVLRMQIFETRGSLCKLSRMKSLETVRLKITKITYQL